MRSLVLGLIATVVASSPAVAQSDAALRQVATGFGRGQCSPLTHVALHPETRAWMTIDPSPWAGWTITQVGPRTLEYVRPGDEVRLMEFEEGIYRDRAPGSMEDAETWTILEHGIHAPDNWRILMRPPQLGDEPRSYAEMIMAGDVFVWTNWVDEASGERVRYMYFACRFAGD